MRKILKKLTVLITLCIALLLVSCEGNNKGELVPLTHLDTLNFLVSNSDLIAIVTLSGGTDEPKLSLFGKLPTMVEGDILSIIKGEENKDKIDILYTPKYLPPDTIKSIIILRNGKHLVFLSKNEDEYNPTTSNSLLKINNGRAYPIWRPDQYTTNPDGIKTSSGIYMKEILNEIKSEIKKANKTLQRTSEQRGFSKSRLAAENSGYPKSSAANLACL